MCCPGRSHGRWWRQRQAVQRAPDAHSGRADGVVAQAARQRQEVLGHAAARGGVDRDGAADGILDGCLGGGQFGAHFGRGELIQIAMVHAVRLDRHAHGRHLAQRRPVQKARLAHHGRIHEEFRPAFFAGDGLGRRCIGQVAVIEGQAHRPGLAAGRQSFVQKLVHAADAPAMRADQLQLSGKGGGRHTVVGIGPFHLAIDNGVVHQYGDSFHALPLNRPKRPSACCASARVSPSSSTVPTA